MPDPWTEAPIRSRREDRLHRAPLAERVADALIDRATGHARGVVVGVTGPWGSGKSSFLSLVAEWVSDNHPGVVVVEFNPWLVTTRDGLVAAFFADVSEALGEAGIRFGKTGAGEKLRDVARSLLDYGKRIAPAGNLLLPGAGTAAAGALDAAQRVLGEHGTLQELRRRLAARLAETGTHVLVLVDEIDRLTDDEVALIAQLVRAVADFAQFSYLLAYDAERVAQALGKGDRERGGAYLEKIVQLQVPLPPASDPGLRALIAGGVREITAEFDARRLAALLDILVPRTIATMRDAKRLLGAFQVLEPMHRFEVEPVDLLGWAAVLTKYPSVEREMNRRRAEIVGDEHTLFGEALLDRLMGSALQAKLDGDEGESRREGALSLLRFFASRFEHDSLSFFLPLCKVLSGGVLVHPETGTAPHPRATDVAREVGDKPPEALAAALRAAERRGTLAEYLATLCGLGWRGLPRPASGVWDALAGFCERVPATGEPSRETPNRMVAKFACGVWSDSLGSFRSFLGEPEKGIERMIAAGHYALPGHVLELHLAKTEGMTPRLMSRESAEQLAADLVAAIRPALADGSLIARLVDISCLRAAVLTRASGWDEACFRALRESLDRPATLDRFVWLCHGDHVPAEAGIVRFVDGVEALRAAMERRRAAGDADMPEALGAAYRRALEAVTVRGMLR